MKRVMISFACLTMAMAAMAQEKTSQTRAGRFAFKEETHDYGTVPEGPVAETDFEFTNTGGKPIVISKAFGSCGCTVPEWPQEPVAPGAAAKIHVRYTTQGHIGAIDKSITINSDAEQQPLVLHIKGTVKAKSVANN